MGFTVLAMMTPLLRPLHPEHPVLRLRNRRAARGFDRQAERVAGLERIENAVVPDPRRRIVGARLVVVLLEYRRQDGVGLLLGECLSLLGELLLLDLHERVRGL